MGYVSREERHKYTYLWSAILRMFARAASPYGGRILRQGVQSMANHLSFDLLSQLAEHRAPALDQARAERHLETCGRCRSELEWLQRIRTGPRQGTDTGNSGRASRDWLMSIRR